MNCRIWSEPSDIRSTSRRTRIRCAYGTRCELLLPIETFMFPFLFGVFCFGLLFLYSPFIYVYQCGAYVSRLSWLNGLYLLFFLCSLVKRRRRNASSSTKVNGIWFFRTKLFRRFFFSRQLYNCACVCMFGLDKRQFSFELSQGSMA